MEKRDSFQLTTLRSEQRNTVYIQGELDLSKVGELRSVLDCLIADTGRELVLSLKELTYIDSTGIGVIVSVLKARDVLQASFRVENVPPNIKRLFDMTGLTKFLRMDTVEA
ncbi:STAS domain-containing protein [Paenibacillus sp. YYML68]|uniref:STAS domain-containing protein n=1 Tax=Paenibacillus sp. YYML68 TaxID=2909250 RepID=UPI00248FAE4A|nr:STAS domain-containing protein [Paenibacillus sp. YYML68]